MILPAKLWGKLPNSLFACYLPVLCPQGTANGFIQKVCEETLLQPGSPLGPLDGSPWHPEALAPTCASQSPASVLPCHSWALLKDGPGCLHCPLPWPQERAVTQLLRAEAKTASSFVASITLFV